MRKKAQSSLQQTALGRAKTKRHYLSFLFRKPDKIHRVSTNIGMTVDSTNPNFIVRIIMGLIVVHILVIGGVMLRGNISKSDRGIAVAPTITPPPAAPAQPAPAAPAQPVVNAQPAQAPALPAPAAQPAQADTQVHITQAPVNMEAVTAVQETQAAPAVQPVAVQPAPAAPAPAGNVVIKPHLVKSGETWGRIAAQYGVTEDVLKGANTQMASLTNLPGGTYLNVPLPADAVPAPAAQPVEKAAARYHVVKRGENLGRIAKKYNIPLVKLLKLNNMTAADARRLQVGRKLKVSE